MTNLLTNIVELYNTGMAMGDPRTADLPLVASPLAPVTIGILYLYFVKSLGPRLMRDLPPFDCRSLMIVYNSLQILANTYVVLMLFRHVWIPQRYNLLCPEIDFSPDNPTAVQEAYIVWFYYILKITDLTDTIFMVLRKKFQQISFLHVYHHFGMICVAWFGVKYITGGPAALFGTLNSFVHMLMYSYYLISLLYPDAKYFKTWKRRITELQLTQFILLMVASATILINRNCGLNKVWHAIIIPQQAFMLFLFWDFYKKTYLTSKNNKKLS